MLNKNVAQTAADPGCLDGINDLSGNVVGAPSSRGDAVCLLMNHCFPPVDGDLLLTRQVSRVNMSLVAGVGLSYAS